MSQNLPEGIINAEPAGGWESGEVADEETRERSEADEAEAGLPSDRRTGYEVEADADVESAEASQGIDPDLSTDDAEATS